MRSNSQKQADKIYRKKVQVVLRYTLNSNTDRDIIEFWQSQENKLALFKTMTRNLIGQPQSLTGADDRN